MTDEIRPAEMGDAKAIREIYAPYVECTAISFESDPPSVAEMGERISQTVRSYPWLVYERDGTVIGYAYASQHRSREAYRWSVDTAAYVRETNCRQGIGSKLYCELLAQLTALGFANAFAGIALPNPASVALHERMGFAPIGVYQKVGFKLGRWHDVGWWQKVLAHPVAPKAPLAPGRP